MHPPDWKTYLQLLSSDRKMSLASQKAFMDTFIVCDPNNPQGSFPPAIVGENDPRRESYTKAMTKVFTCLKFSDRVPGKAAKQVLPWLLEDYRNPANPLWQGTVESEIAKSRSGGTVEDNSAKLYGCLNKLNYISQHHRVEDEAKDVDLAKIFLVPSSGILTQKWFVKRLCEKIPNHVIAKGFGVSANPKWNQNATWFWMLLSQYVGVYEPCEPGEIIQKLADLCPEAPLIMAIYDVHVLELDMLNDLVNYFWKPLIEKVREQSIAGERRDCILFLTTDSSTNCNVNIQDIVRLDPWDRISISDLNAWLKDQDIKQFLLDCNGKKSNLMPENGDLSGSLETMLSRICKVFDVEKVCSLERYWELNKCLN
jgi:hypothetical protein